MAQPKAFKYKDLMINVIAKGSSGGGASMPGPDQDITDFPSPITPIIVVANFTPKFAAVHKLATTPETQLAPGTMEYMATQVGRAVMGGLFMKYSLCAEDSATCAARQIISPVAMADLDLRFEDLSPINEILCEAVDQITALENKRLSQAKEDAKDYIPMMEGALEFLKRQ